MIERDSLSQLHTDLERKGFALVDWPEDGPLDSLAVQLGKPVPSAPGRSLVDVLVPQPGGASLPGTLSSLHGVGSFPFHTETAHWRTPVDWVILRCVNPGAGNRPTLLIDGLSLHFRNNEIRQLTRSLMIVRNGSRSFLAPLVMSENTQLLFRHDPGCMRPSSKGDQHLKEVFERRLMNANPTEIAWKSGQCVIFDNRRMLHSRAESSTADFDRCLERIYIVKERS